VERAGGDATDGRFLVTPDEIIYEARSFVGDASSRYPVTDAMLYARISTRQRQLFAEAATVNREYYGQLVDANVDDDGCIDLTDLEGTGMHPIESVDQVEILSPGNRDWRVRQKVTICRADERHMHDPPRCTIRSHTLAGVMDHVALPDGDTRERNDLKGVESVRIWYSRRPRAIDGEGLRIDMIDENGDPVRETEQKPVEIGDPWHWLLVWDLVQSLVGRTVTEDGEQKAGVVMLAKDAEAELFEIYKRHVAGYTYGRETVTE